MPLAALRRAFRARPGTTDYERFAVFLENLDEDECSWKEFVCVLERDVIPVVIRHHPAEDADEIASTCLTLAFEVQVSEWLGSVRGADRIRRLIEEARIDDARAELSRHLRFRGRLAERVRAVWNAGRPLDAVSLLLGARSARSHFIAGARAEIREAQRKQRRQSQLMSRNGIETLAAGVNVGRHGLAAPGSRSLCGAELESDAGARNAWRISALPPAQLLSQELADRVRRMLGAVEDLGPSHTRVFKLLLEGFSQRSIAKVEGRHPAAISRRVNDLRALCRVQLLD